MKEMAEELKQDAQKEEGDENDILELFKAIFYAAGIALIIRSFALEPFNIPSGSLLPTLQIGDYLFVEKYSYGYSRYSFPFGIVQFDGRVMEDMPARGDIAVFRQPKKPSVDYIKRIVGLPGDKIQVKGGILHINDEPAQRDVVDIEDVSDGIRSILYKRYIETMPGGLQHYIYEISDAETYDNTPVYEVPEGHYFAMGDNRDGSLDSRAQMDVGFIPAENLVGRAWFIFFSTEGVGDKCEKDGMLALARSAFCHVWEWPQAVRYERIFKRVQSL